MKKQILLFCFLFFAMIGFAENVNITGVVTSAEDGEPLIGASVQVKGNPSQGVATDIDGNYTISVPAGATLQYSFVGCKTQERTVVKSGTYNIVLASDSHMLNEVVAIGYGVMKKSDLTGSVTSVDADKLKKTPASNLANALQGQAAGVTINSNSGQPGAAPEVRIRGVGTVNGASPIYVVDGVIVDDISFLSPNDIQSTEVLKDASATAIYGSRGANGVIIVTTRNGATDEEVLAAAKLANCEEFAEKLPDKWNTNIGENGCALSGGERQRISIARAFLKDAPIILLDEATASLDVENETAIQEALSRLIKNKTVLIIAHRMRTVAGADQVVVLSGGIVAEQGSPAELYARKGLYTHMVDLQSASQNWTI